ncbi:MAG: hypothetical protein UT90_C0011G0003 [Parcubacteria group bacterium GW2011_GWA1_40_21]|nr:MAG: hypothetical protein UT80_C0019G0002 [Parcubacteria group bacterium GW2011_GWC1_40_13]KKR53277.1 MAG: hypothetical protein UT90_C0011G0003 [Parcubacteria group bacterium GW2011_GWA1_40_21]
MSFFKNFLMKKLLKSKMKDIPEAEQEKMLNAIEKNPDFFQNIASEVQAKMKEGKDQMTATMEVMQKHQDELKKIMNN